MKLFSLFLISFSVLIVQCLYQSDKMNEIHQRPFTDQISLLTKIFDEIQNETSSEMSVCRKCEVVVANVLNFRRSGANRNSMVTLMSELCQKFNGYVRSVCQKISDIKTDVILYIIDKKNVKPEEVCGVYFQKDGCTNPYAKNWVIDIPSANNDVSKDINTFHDSSLKIVQITDVHYDPLYKPGSNAKCGLPLCCEEINGIPINPENVAGTFGDYRNCDMSRNSVDNLLKEIKISQTDIDYVYFTGDIVAHKDWETSKDGNLQTIKEFYDYVFHYFGNISVYPILGNHEAHPSNLYAPLNVFTSTSNSVSTKWLFNAVADYWSKWLPKNALKTIKLGGYYTVLVQSGFRIVALNSNVCFTENYWLLYDDEDPYGQLQWLVNILAEAEKNNEKVHILSHIPPGEAMCHKQWQYNFNRIVQRFSKTISAHFNGHTHLDELRLYRNESNPNEVINVAYNGGSFTTFIGLNPDYRIYDIDPQNLMVLDFHQYTFNLSLANSGKQARPDWYKLYSFKAAYKLVNLNYENLMSWNENLWSDSKLAEQYVQYHVRESEFAFENGCNKSCIQSQICHITAINAEDSIKCGAYNMFS